MLASQIRTKMPVLESPSRIIRPTDVNSDSKSVKDDDKVFVCEVTGKAFTQYGDFAYNFMNLRMEHWRCEYTKRSGLTYMQALESKQKVYKQTKNLPKPIRLAVYHLIKHSKHMRQELLAHDIYFFVKDRYFKGETVNIYLKNTKSYTPATILSVSSLPNCSLLNETSPQTFSYDLTPTKQQPGLVVSKLTVGFDSIKRTPRVYTEAINRCLIYTNTKVGSDGLLYLKDSALSELDQCKFEDLFVHNMEVPQLKSQSVVRMVKYPNGTLNGVISPKSQAALKSPNKIYGIVDSKKTEAKHDANERFKQFLKTWQHPKDDLQLDDHKMLPNFPLINFDGIPNESVGELLSILSFFDDFSEFEELKDLFGYSVDFEMLSNAVTKPTSINDYYEIVYKLNNFLLKNREELNDEKAHNDNENEPEFWMNHYTKLLKHEGETNVIAMSEILRLQLLKFCQSKKMNKDGHDSVLSREFCSIVNEINEKLMVTHIAHLPVCDKMNLLKALLREVTYCDALRQCAEQSREEARRFSYNIFRLRASKHKYADAIHKFKKGKRNDLPEGSLDELLAKYKECEEKLSSMASNWPSQKYFGRDRAYRRYLLFKSIPALCVEANSTNIGDCSSHVVMPDPVLAKCSYSEKIKELKKRCFNQKARPSYCNSPIKENITELLNRLNMCSASKDSCPIHKVSQERWYYISTPEMFTDLLTSLNDRGIRESSLKNSLKKNKSYIESCLSKCTLPQILSSSNLPADGPEFESVEKLLRSAIYVFEDKLSYNELGQVSVKNREDWLSRVVLKGEDDTENPPVRWGSELQFSESGPLTVEEPFRHMSKEQWELHKRLMSNLHSIVLRLGQGVDKENLKNPLVVTTRSGYRRVKHYENLDKWQHSLMTQTSSLAQVALHLKALQDSIIWEKSVHRRSCANCKKTHGIIRMVRCEKCNTSYHVYCLKPKRKTVPAGVWVCSSCRDIQNNETHEEPENISSTVSEEVPSKVAKLANGYKSNGEEKQKLQSTLDSFIKKPVVVLRKRAGDPVPNGDLQNKDVTHNGRSMRTRRLH